MHPGGTGKNGKVFLLCTIDDGRFLVKRGWLVRLEIKDEKIIGHSVTTELVGP